MKKHLISLMVVIMTTVMVFGLSSCSKDDDNIKASGNSNAILSRLEGAWQLQYEVKYKVMKDGTESVVWEENIDDHIYVFKVQDYSVIEAWSDDRGNWNKRSRSFTIDEETNTLSFSNDVFTITSLTGSQLKWERSGGDFGNYITLYRESYKKINNVEKIVGPLDK